MRDEANAQVSLKNKIPIMAIAHTLMNAPNVVAYVVESNRVTEEETSHKNETRE